jgi:hypothetical protein
VAPHCGRVSELLIALVSTTLLGCTLDSRPLVRPSPSEPMNPGAASSRAPSQSASAIVSDDAAAPPITTSAADAAGSDGGLDVPTGSASVPTRPAATMPLGSSASDDAGMPPEPTRPDNASSDAATAEMTPAQGCTRDLLRQHADAYLQAMAQGDVKALNAHPEVRYTENGQTQTLGLGLWLSRPQPQFARHVLDESRCSSVTEAVLSDLRGRTVFGVRLRYVAEQLIDVEAQVVPKNSSYYDPDALIPSGVDRWLEPIASSARMSRDALVSLAEHYFDSSTDASLLPPHAPECKRRQNGTPLDTGDCGSPAGNERFEERRFPVIDETAGIVTAIVIYRNFIGMYLIKAQSNTIQNIDVVGGAATASSGW